jgi:hypothetical protein
MGTSCQWATFGPTTTSLRAQRPLDAFVELVSADQLAPVVEAQNREGLELVLQAQRVVVRVPTDYDRRLAARAYRLGRERLTSNTFAM